MFDIKKYFTDGLKNTLLFRNNSGTSHSGPWVQVYDNTKLDRWHIGDFSSAEYTISADLNTASKEILKVLVTASVNTASVMVYSRNNTGRDLVDVTATVNSSYVDIVLNPIIGADSASSAGTKVIYAVQYFHNQNPLTS
jgi:hypothetical protein